MDELIRKKDAIELLSQRITMSMCLSVDECNAKERQREIDLQLIESIPPVEPDNGEEVTNDLVDFLEEHKDVEVKFMPEYLWSGMVRVALKKDIGGKCCVCDRLLDYKFLRNAFRKELEILNENLERFEKEDKWEQGI